MKRSIPLTILLLVLGLAGCQATRVQSDYDETVDFARYATFNWLPEPNQAQRNPYISEALDTRIRQAIEDELEADGYRKNPDGRPDVYVVYHTEAERKMGHAYLATHASGLNTRPGGVRAESYQEGTLVIDLIDAGSEEVVWSGRATGAVKNLSLGRKKLYTAIEDIFAEFPPADSF